MLDYISSSFKGVNSSANLGLQVLLGIPTSATENVGDLGLFYSEMVQVDLKLPLDLDFPVVKGWFFPIYKDRRV